MNLSSPFHKTDADLNLIPKVTWQKSTVHKSYREKQ